VNSLQKGASPVPTSDKEGCGWVVEVGNAFCAMLQAAAAQAVKSTTKSGKGTVSTNVADYKDKDLVEMKSLQFVDCSWFIGLIGLGFRFTRNKSTETELCVLPCPSPVSSSTHLDAPGVHSLAGYVAIPPCALSDPELR
jgi:hypothetical protein